MKRLWQIIGTLGFGFILPHAVATTFYVNVSNTVPLAPYTNWPTAATNIQDAIDVSSDGDLVLVTNGVYASGGRVVYSSSSNRVVINKAITVQSVNGADNTVIQGNRLFGNGAVRCVYLTNGASLVGFTLTNGGTRNLGTFISFKTDCGGGAWCESTNAYLVNCLIVSNIAYLHGGGIYFGSLSNCTLTGNLAISNSLGNFGGGIYYGMLKNCALSNNLAGNEGGGAFASTLINCDLIGNGSLNPFPANSGYNLACVGGGAVSCILEDCILKKNYTRTLLFNNGGYGGGACYSQLTRCMLFDNSSGHGGGAASSTLNLCIVSNNSASLGGGSYDGSATNVLFVHNFASIGGGVNSNKLVNCTVTDNLATNSTGGISPNGFNLPYQIQNSIVYGNYSLNDSLSSNIYSPANIPQFGRSIISNSCIGHITFTNIGNITNQPEFVDALAGNFHLQTNSPCINTGKNYSVINTNDLDGNPRIAGGTVDIGCYEYQSPSSTLSYAWAQQFNLPTDGTADFTDADGDGLNNWQEWIAGTVPTNAASVLLLNSPSNTVSGLKVGWQSVNTRTYFLQRSTNLPAFSTIQSNLTGQANATTFTDTSATNSGPYFYRVGVQ